MIEVIVALAVGAMIAALCLTCLGFFNRMVLAFSPSDDAAQFRRTSVYIQKDLDKSDVVYFVDGKVYLRDMETPSYLNYFRLEGTNLYRFKTRNDGTDFALGQKSQMAVTVTDFSFEPVMRNDAFSGCFRLAMKFYHSEKIYEKIIRYPGSVENIKSAFQ